MPRVQCPPSILRGATTCTSITLTTSKIRTTARIQILVQCHQMLSNIETPRHESEARCLGFDVHQAHRGGTACTGNTFKTSKIHTMARIQISVQCHQIFSIIEAMSHESEAESLGFDVHRAFSGVALPLWGLT
jgi:hypothetical protein